MKHQFPAAILVLIFVLVMLCSCTSASHISSTPVPEPSNTPSLPYQAGGISVDALHEACQRKSVGSYLWISEEELILESAVYPSKSTAEKYDVIWFLWNISTGEIKSIYHGRPSTYNSIAKVSTTSTGMLEIKLFGGEIVTINRDAKTGERVADTSYNASDPLTTYFDSELQALFFCENQQMKILKDNNLTVLYTLSSNSYPRCLSVSPDKSTFAFAVAKGDAWVSETILIDLNSLSVSSIQKDFVAPYYCWLENRLCAIENRDEGTTKIYYGDNLEQEILIEYPVPSSGFFYFEAGQDNLGAQNGLIPFAKEYQTVNGEWISEVNLLFLDNGTPKIQTVAVFHNENIFNLTLSPKGDKLFFSHFEAFTGKNPWLTIATVPK
ncbi:hypothetical protein [Pygmaiobacter massiliensis]|uniref:hypothetical protein n=1 Tax=Pygmaiobacter massiliensis TaxID=1917873 RepID=UPI00289FE518|nr:hypothetical protein [Pygmaiobacter massiliensis]